MKTHCLKKALLLAVAAGHFGIAGAAQKPAKKVAAKTKKVVAKARYAITDLGALGGVSSMANAINNNGVVVGQALDAQGKPCAVKWVNGKIRWLAAPSELSSNALDINNQGVIVGCAGRRFSEQSRAIYWRTDAEFSEVGFPADFKKGGSACQAINDKNQIVGYFGDTKEGENAGEARGFRLNLDDKTVAPLAADDDVNIFPRGINNEGEIVMSVTYGDVETGWKWPTAMPLNPTGKVRLMDINDAGQVAFAWGNKAAIGNTKGNDISLIEFGIGEPRRINQSGAMVGIGEGGATLYEKREAVNLNTQIPANSGWKLEGANGINDRGEIVGYGSYKGSARRAFLLKPTSKTPLLDSLKLPATK